MTKAISLKFRTPLIALLLLVSLAMAALPLSAQSIEFRPAIELALKHSGVMLAASADRARAAARYRAERYAYMPTVVFGSGLGYSVGQPIAIAGEAPSLYNVVHNQTLFNLATRETIKAAHSDSIAADIGYVDRTAQVILDTSLLYIELDSTQQRLAAAQQQKQSVDHALYIAQQRQQEGVASLLDSKRAALDSARVDLRIAELETSLDVLRERLGRAIGRSPATLETVSGSIPAPPDLPAADDVASVALANSNSVRVADEHVRAAQARARAEHRMKYPSIDFAGQFAEFATFNNYAQYYKEFSPHNYSFGINLRVPIINLAQNARAAAADAEALHAEADAQNVRDQVAADAVRAQHAIRQLQASAKVSRLEYEVAQANVDAVQLQVQSGHANAHDQELARAEIANRQVLVLQSQFEYIRAQLQLLRQTGELQGWALGNR
ncbi:MAG: TolC family protein [Candidatus Korobacteraceae bacterium]|jgi:outer membrane protein TolC